MMKYYFMAQEPWGGSVEAGELADLIVLDKNPLENLRNSNTVDNVMNGRLCNANTLDEIYPKRKKGTMVWNRQRHCLVLIDRSPLRWNSFHPGTDDCQSLHRYFVQ